MPPLTNKLNKKAKIIFDLAQKDLTYITEDPKLLALHVRFINKTHYSASTAFDKLVEDDEEAKQHFKVFLGLKKWYPSLYEWWMHLLSCCYDKTHSLYPYFGGKGIKMSKEFLDSKKFCIWCLKHKLTSRPFTYTKYLLRKDKTKNYSPKNCYVMLEKTRRECKSLALVFNSLKLIRLYEESHDPTVSFNTYLTRCYVYDFDPVDAKSFKYVNQRFGECAGFSPHAFYYSVADENSCNFDSFMYRIHNAYLTPGFIVRPYDMLKPEYSFTAEAAKQGFCTYLEKWTKAKNQEQENNLIYKEDSVYTDNPSVNIYEDTDNVYS